MEIINTKKLKDLVSLINRSKLGRVCVNQDVIRGPQFIISYIKENLDGTITKEKDGFKPRLVKNIFLGGNTRFLIEKSNDIYFITKIICVDYENNRFAKSIKILKDKYIKLISDVNNISDRDIKKVVEALELDNEHFIF